MKVSLRASVALIALVTGAPMAIAQTAPAADPAAGEGQDTSGDIVVTGIRQSLSRAAEIKRESTAVVDSIVAEDIGKLPDLTTASALQRVPVECRQIWDGILRGLSYQQLSGELGVSEGALRVRAHRCRKRAAEALAGNVAAADDAKGVP